MVKMYHYFQNFSNMRKSEDLILKPMGIVGFDGLKTFPKFSQFFLRREKAKLRQKKRKRCFPHPR